MPLKYALPLLFIGALVLSATTGCVSNSNPTAAPTVAATATLTATAKPTSTTTSGFDPLLIKLETAIKNDTTLTKTLTERRPKSANQSVDVLYAQTILPDGTVITATFTNEGTTAAATGRWQLLTQGEQIGQTVTHFAQSDATTALGHKPNTINDAAFEQFQGDPTTLVEYIQYDNIFAEVLNLGK